MTEQEKRDFLDTAMKRLKKAIDADAHNRTAALEDLRFLNGDQWDLAEKQRRKLSGRPTLMINLLPKYVDQVTGDERHNRPRVKIRPSDSKADSQIAKIREALVYQIEYDSNAEAIYDQACEMQVSCSYGAWRILTRYTDENPFLQEIYLQSVLNPFLVYYDSECKDQMYADARWCFVLEKLPIEAFEEKYKDSPLPSNSLWTGQGLGSEHWYDKETVTVAEYFVREGKKKWVFLMEDGQVHDQDEMDKLLQEWEANRSLALASGATPEQIPPQPQPVKKRQVESNVIQHYTITASDVLEGPVKVAGRYIPVVLLHGKERNIEGKRYLRSLIRDAKDPQRLVNYWETSAAETVALAPKAPWLGTARQFEGFEEDYRQANTENFPFLKYNPDNASGQLAPPPSRTHPGEPPVAVFMQKQSAHDNLKQVIGMFAADVGDKGREISGAAVLQRQKPGDISTYAYLDNLSRAIAHSGKIINEMIPEVYDTERDVRLRHLDGTETSVPVNTTVQAAVQAIQANPEVYKGLDVNKLQQSMVKGGGSAKFNDLAFGRYSVVVTVGPSYATARQESVDNLFRLTQTSPKLMQLAADLIVENMDFKDADKLAARFRRTLPPGMVPQQPGEPPTPPLPPPPQAQIAMAKLDVEKAKLKVQQLKALKEGIDAKGEMRATIIELLHEIMNPQQPKGAVAPSQGG